MNLATEPWIPVLRDDGSRAPVSLEQAFAEGEGIRDLAVPPPERIAIMRLLLCIAHAGLQGPGNHDEWRECKPRIAEAAGNHLRGFRDRFSLLGDGPRFGQLYSGTPHEPKFDGKNPTWASKLDLTLATGHNPTVFDNAGLDRRPFSPEDLARMLVTFLCFAPQMLGRRYKGRSPCSRDSMLHTLLLGSSLLETVWLNLIDDETIRLTYGDDAVGRPAWLAMPESAKDETAVSNATHTYLGRLLPLPHAVLLGGDGSTVEIAQDCGFGFPPWTGEPAEPTATTVTPNGRSRKVLRAQLDRAIWRDLPALATKRWSDAPRGALAWQRFPEDRPCDFWVGALVTDGRAKVLDLVESTFHLPVNVGNDIFVTLYSGGVGYADRWATAIEKGLRTYRSRLGDKLRGKRGGLLKGKAASLFWTAIESAANDVLIPLCANPPDQLNYLDYSWEESRWGPLVRRAAEDALAFTCPRGSARQAAAFGEARQKMWRSRPRPKRNLK